MSGHPDRSATKAEHRRKMFHRRKGQMERFATHRTKRDKPSPFKHRIWPEGKFAKSGRMA